MFSEVRDEDLSLRYGSPSAGFPTCPVGNPGYCRRSPGLELALERRGVVTRHVRVQLLRLFLAVRRHIRLPAIDHRARGAVRVGAVPLSGQQGLEIHQVLVAQQRLEIFRWVPKLSLPQVDADISYDRIGPVL